MARVNAPLLAFNRGEVSKLALARVDVAKLQLAAECQLNWEPKVLGSMGLRSGLEFIGEIKDDAACKLFPFVFSKLDTAEIEVTGSIVRVRVDDELVTRTAVSTAVSDPTFLTGSGWTTSDTTAGCTTTIAAGVLTLKALARGGIARAKQTLSIGAPDLAREHGLRLVVTNGPVTLRVGSTDGLANLIAQTTLDTGEHALTFMPDAANPHAFIQIETTTARGKTLSSVSIDAAGTMQVAAPWATGDLPSLRFTQSGDIIYVAAYGKQQYKIERRGATAWSVVKYRSDNGPFQDLPALLANFTPSVYEGNGTLTSDRPYFTALHVGTLFRLFCKGQANQTVLGAQNAFSDPVRVTGVGVAARNYGWTSGGSWAGTLTLQRSFDGPDSGYTDVSNITSNGSLASATGSSASTPDLDNAIAWERVGFKAGDYVSGAALIASAYTAGGAYGICRVTGFTSSLVVAIEVLVPFSSITATDAWVESDWSDLVGWPTSVAFQEGRLWWTGRDKVWGSQSNNYTGYGQLNLATGEGLGDSGAIIESFGEGPVDSVNWLLPLTRLLAGREQSIASIRSSSFDEPLTGTNFSVKDCSTQGAARLPALKIDKRGLFVGESGQRIYELDFNAQAFDYSTHDVTRLNVEIGATGFTDAGVARQPDTVAYFPRGDGLCAALLYDPDDEVVAFYRLATLGIIEGVCIRPATTGPDSLVDFVVKRTVGGVTRRFIERLAPRANCVGGLLNQLLDCHVVYQGMPVASITLAHLPNTAVTIWADGVSLGTVTTDGAGVATLPNAATASNIVAGLTGAQVTYTGAAAPTLTGLSAYEGLTAEVFCDQQPSGTMVRAGPLRVSGGIITLPNGWDSSNIVAFFGYMAPFMSAKLAYAANIGSPLTQKKQIDHVGLVMFDTHAQGIQAGQRFDQLNAMPGVEDGGDVDPDTVWGEYDKPAMEVAGEWDSDARLCLLAAAPFPCKLGGAVVSVQTNEK